MKRDEIIVFDVETTGLCDSYDEIVQLSIIDGNGKTLFNEYIKPEFKTSWKEAERVHGISPEMVADKKLLTEHMDRLREIFSRAEMWIGYNTGFDIGFLTTPGLIKPKFKDGGYLYYLAGDKEVSEANVYDVMQIFAPIYGEYNEYFGDYKWQKLITCAEHYNYEFKAHDSLEDVKATLHCFNCMVRDGAIKLGDPLE